MSSDFPKRAGLAALATVTSETKRPTSLVERGRGAACCFPGGAPDLDATAEDDEVLPEDVIGFLVVMAEGEPVGILTDIMQMPGQDVYAIDSGKKEILIPAVPEIVRQINFDSETITITPMEGLLEL